MSRMPRVTLSAAFLACLLLVLLPACVPLGAVPWYQGEDRYVRAINFPRNINEETEHFLTPGQTSRKDVLLKLGEPDFVVDDERTLIYEGEVTPGGKVWTAVVMTVIGPGSGPWYPFEYERYRLTIRFDELGRVESGIFQRFGQQ